MTPLRGMKHHCIAVNDRGTSLETALDGLNLAEKAQNVGLWMWSYCYIVHHRASASLVNFDNLTSSGKVGVVKTVTLVDSCQMVWVVDLHYYYCSEVSSDGRTSLVLRLVLIALSVLVEVDAWNASMLVLK